VQTGGPEIQAYVESLPPPGPSAYTQPREVVLGFLHASASYAFDPDAARQFLLPTLRTKWRPGPVTVVSSVSAPNPAHPVHSPLDASSAAGPTVSVVLKGQRLATLSQTGQYQYQPRISSYGFTLQKVNGVWLISLLPSSLLLLQADFERVYQARNLFFFAGPPSPQNADLVPDAVYAPLQNSVSALNTNLASELVTGLLNDDHGWLRGATITAFPRGTRLLGVKFSGQTAIVTLGGAAVRATPIQKTDMAEQLYATLSSTAYSAPLAQAVQLQINGGATNTGSLPNGTLVEVQRGPVVYQSGVNTLAEGHSPSPGPWESGSAGISAIAADPAVPTGAPQPPPIAVAVEDGHGCAVYLRTMRNEELTGPYRRFPLSTTGGQCTSLSWDGNGNVWAAAGRKIWVLVLNGAQNWQALPVALPANLSSGGQPVPQILAVQVAPDAVRAAMLIRSGASKRLVLAAVTEDQQGGETTQVSMGSAVSVGTGLRGPMAMSWFSPYDLMVLDKSGIAVVPLAGGPAQLLRRAPSGADSLTTDGVTVVVGTADHEIWVSGKLAPAPTALTWRARQPGAIPVYPG
jgi:Lipoprotein LpqB beta-propeller domain/Sporulation and spore germination